MNEGAESPIKVEPAAIATMEKSAPPPEINNQPEATGAPATPLKMSAEDQAAIDKITEMFNQQQPGGATPEHPSEQINPEMREELDNVSHGNKRFVTGIVSLLRKLRVIR